MKLSCLPVCYFNDLFITKTMSVEDWVKMAKEFGFNGIELYRSCLEGRGSGEINQLLTLIKKNGLEISMFTSSAYFSAVNEEELQKQIARIHQDIDFSSFFGVRVLNLTGGALSENISQAEVLDSITRGIKESLDYAQKRGIIVAIEDHPQVTSKIENLLHLLGSVNDQRLKVNFDTANPLEAGDNGVELAKAINGRIANVHASDRNKDFEYTTIGEGAVDFPSIFKILKNSGYDGWISLEAGGKKSKEAIKKGITFIRETWDKA